MKLKILFPILLLSTACETSAVDQCLRREVFKECTASSPQDKDTWSSVIRECDRVSRYQSIRQLTEIRMECRQ